MKVYSKNWSKSPYWKERFPTAQGTIKSPNVFMVEAKLGNIDSDDSTEVMQLLNKLNQNGNILIFDYTQTSGFS